MKKLIMAVVMAALTSGAFAAEPWSVRMVRSELVRHPDALQLDWLKAPKWTYTVGLELKAIGDVYDAYGDEALKNYVLGYADHMVGDDGSIKTYKKSDFNLDMICSGRMLLWSIDHSQGKADKAKAAKYKKAADLLHSQLFEQPRTSEGAYWHKQVYPYQVWLDGLYMAEPFYADWLTRYKAPGCVELRDGFEEIATQFLVAAKRTYDPATGLYRHGWEETRAQAWSDPVTGQSAHAWGRAIGWYVMAIVDVLDFMPSNTKGRAGMIRILQDLYKVLPKYRDPETGMWYQVLDQPGREGNYVESTCSAMFAYAMLKGVRMGYLDASLGAEARSTYEKLIETFIREDADGTISLTRCCEVGGLGGKNNRDGSFEYYLSEPIRDNDPKGVGPFIWASLEYEGVAGKARK